MLNQPACNKMQAGKMENDVMNSITKNNRDFLPGLSNIWDDFFTDDFFPRSARWTHPHSMPAVNVRETDHQLELQLAVPGMDKKDFNIEFENNMLVISAEHKIEKNEKEPGDEGFTRREFSYQSFRRAFNLPEHLVQGDQLKATYKDGILQVTIPKAESVKKKSTRRIEIT
jgi:HSP20 family protein